MEFLILLMKAYRIKIQMFELHKNIKLPHFKV